MKIPTTYQEAKLRHPKEVAAAVRALRSSASMQKAAPPSAIEWSYSITVRVDSLSMKDILSGEHLRKAEAVAKLTLEERIRDQLRRSGAHLTASTGRWRHTEEVDLPPEWERHTRVELTKLQEQQDAYEALPVREKELRAAEAFVAAVQGGGLGFFQVPQKK